MPFNRDTYYANKAKVRAAEVPGATKFGSALTGQRFGRLVVTTRAPNTSKGAAQWHCDCDCGNSIIARGGDLRGGKISCGCHAAERNSAQVRDLTGQRFGRLIVKGRDGSNKDGPLWSCVCDCGATKVASGRRLRDGRLRSCGCLNREQIQERNRETALDLAGERFGRLFVVRRDGSIGKFSAWRCNCDCGGAARIRSRELVEGKTVSCGCYAVEMQAEKVEFFAALRQQRTDAAMLDIHEETETIRDS